MGDHRGLEGGHAFREGTADVAESHDAHRLAVERARPGSRHTAAPASGVYVPVERDDLAVPGEQERERMVGDLAHPDVRDVHDDYAQVAGGRNVDHVVAHARPNHHLEPFEGAHHATG